MASTLWKRGLRIVLWILVVIFCIKGILNYYEIKELEKKDYVSIPNFTYDGNISRFQYTVNPESPDVCSNIDVGNVSRFFNNFGGNFDNSFHDWRNILSNLVTDDDNSVTSNLKQALCLLSRTSGLQQVKVTTQSSLNTTSEFFYNQFNDPISTTIYVISIIIGTCFFLLFLYKIIYKIGIFKYNNPLGAIIYIIIWAVLFGVLIGFAFKEDEIVRSTGASNNINQDTSMYYRVLTGYIVTFFILIVIANINLYMDASSSMIYKLTYDISIVMFMVLIIFVLIIMPFVFVFFSLLFYLLSQSFKLASKKYLESFSGTTKLGIEYKNAENSCNATSLMPEIYSNSWTLPFFQILLGFIDEFVDDNLTENEQKEKNRIENIENNNAREKRNKELNSKIHKRLKNALKGRDLTESAIENDNVF
jgi:hypothetical protein